MSNSTATESPSSESLPVLLKWRPAKKWIVLAVAPLAFLPLAEFLALIPAGTSFFQPASLLLIPLLLLTVVMMAIALPMLLFPNFRARALCLLMLGGLFVGASLAGLRMTHLVRMSAFHWLAERSQSLVSAIRQYERTHGKPPNALDDLVPEFMKEVPSTRMTAYPQYRYYAGKRAMEFDQNPWILQVDAPLGFLNFDMFMYFPRQNYPETGYGGWLQRIDDWAYVHE